MIQDLKLRKGRPLDRAYLIEAFEPMQTMMLFPVMSSRMLRQVVSASRPQNLLLQNLLILLKPMRRNPYQLPLLMRMRPPLKKLRMKIPTRVLKTPMKYQMLQRKWSSLWMNSLQRIKHLQMKRQKWKMKKSQCQALSTTRRNRKIIQRRKTLMSMMLLTRIC